MIAAAYRRAQITQRKIPPGPLAWALAAIAGAEQQADVVVAADCRRRGSMYAHARAPAPRLEGGPDDATVGARAVLGSIAQREV